MPAAPATYSGPTYDQAVQTYKTELDLLSELEREKALERSPYDGQLREVQAKIGESLLSLARAKGQIEIDKSSLHPDTEPLHRRIREERIASNECLIESETLGAEELAKLRDNAVAILKAIDARFAPRIEEQKARIEKAKAVKDEAEKHR
jgi:hypothetical protein